VPAPTLIWLIVALIGMADGITLLVQGMSLEWSTEWRNILLLLAFLMLARLFRQRQMPEAARFTTALVQAVAFAHVGTIFTYLLMAASPFPMADPLFERADLALGFDWLAWFQWIEHHPTIRIVLALAYDSMIPQVFALVALFSFADPRRVDELLVAGALAIIIIFPFVYLLPSIGAFAPHGITGADWENDIIAMRSHTTLIISPTAGIVTFPSYHTVLGVLLVNTVRGQRWLFGPLLVLNALMIASVMNTGGHYLVDMLSGIAVGAVALGATQYLLALCSGKLPADENRSMAPMPT
jgi:hypothetical protein